MMTQDAGQRHFALTGFTHTESKDLCLKISLLGGVYNENTRFCSHVVCKFPARTEKFLVGCAMGKWLLTPKYIQDSHSHGAWLEEGEYEWGANKALLLPPDMWPLLMAPHRWREKLVKTRTGAFSNWRVAILITEQSSKVIFRRLLECGGAKVEMITLPVNGSTGAGLTHVFHDESPDFAKILKMLQKKRIPCLPLVFISDYLLETGAMAPDRRRSHHGFVLTGFSRKECCELSLKITTLGGVYNETKQLQRDCSHVVCRLPARTEKFLMGCAMGKWILRVDYIHDSYHVGHWVGESQYEWGPQNAPEVPPSIQWMLTAPRRCRVKKLTSRWGTFHGWRVAVLVKQPQPKAVFKRLLECGGARVDEMRYSGAHSKRSTLTHIFHDGSMCFADMLRPYRQMGVPCLKPEYISDCLLGEQLPDMEHYRTVDGVEVWPQLSHCSLFTSQSSTVTSSSLTDPDLSPATLSPIRPLASKDINTEMTAKTTASKTRRPWRTPNVPVWSVSQPPILGQDLQRRKKVVTSTPRDQNRHRYPSSSDTELVKKTRSSRKQKPLQKGQTLLVNFCQLLRTPQANDQNATPMLTDSDIQGSGDSIAPKAGCKGQRSEVNGHNGQTKGPLTIIGKVLPKHKMTVVGKVVKVVGRVVDDKSLPCDKLKKAVSDEAQCEMIAVSGRDVARWESMQDREIVQKSSSQDTEMTQPNFNEVPKVALQNLSQNTVVETSWVSSKTGSPCSVATRTVTKRKSPCVESTGIIAAALHKKQKECGRLAMMSPLVKNTAKVKTKLCLPFSYPTCAMFEACLDDGELFYATDIIALSVSTARYPTARLLHLALGCILLPSTSAVLSHRVHRLLHTIVWEHPPVCPSMQCIYLNAISYHDDNSVQSEYLHPTRFLFSVISTLLVGDHEVPHSQNYLLCLEFLVALFEKDFSIFIQHRQQDSEDKKGGPRSSLIGQVFWPAGRMGHLNVPCKQLLSFFSRALQLGTHYKAVLLRLLNRLVAMVAEHHRLVDCGARHPVNQIHLPHTAVMFARELAYIIQGTLTDSTARQDSAGGLREAVGGLQLPWLSVHVCQTLLDLYDDTLLPASLQNPPLQITFSSIVSRYFYMLPRQREPAMTDDIQSLDEGGSMCQGTAEAGGQQKMTDSMYRTRGSKMAAKLAKSRNSKGETALHVACSSNNAAKVRELLCIPGMEINCQDHSGFTPLHQAALRGHIDCVASLLKYKPTNSILSFLKCETVDGRPNGARLDIMSKEGNTILHAAVAENQLQVVQQLLQFGGKCLLRLRNSAGQTPLRVAVSEEMRQLLLDPQSRKASFSSSQDSELSQSSYESSEPPSQSDSPPPDGAYRDGLDPETPVSREDCRNYVYLVSYLVLSYVKLHSLCHVRDSKSRHSTDPVESRVDTSATNGDADTEELTLRRLHRHVGNFHMHLQRITGGAQLEFCKLDLIVLQTIALALK